MTGEGDVEFQSQHSWFHRNIANPVYGCRLVTKGVVRMVTNQLACLGETYAVGCLGWGR